MFSRVAVITRKDIPVNRTFSLLSDPVHDRRQLHHLHFLTITSRESNGRDETRRLDNVDVMQRPKKAALTTLLGRLYEPAWPL